MKKKTDEFISFVIDRNEFLKNDVKKCLEYWMPDAPAPILLFSLVGKSIVKHLSFFNENEKLSLFQHIELGMTSDNEELAIAVATGLVEALVTASDANESVWKEIEYYLQVESKKHALAWKNFGQ
ncbi:MULTISPECIES: hypothetical protein [Pantoea]|jgi:hypothetical protein|uniref:Uncharacterized protein n=1 Tax=Pantoea trifolii TaxID=2968030 RepID=A0ABT1VRM9_9GAMM|nr:MULTISPECIES: hypothetical protein [unclassified Pantoea]MCQ8230190.1 hypothetical protein [Pantoea sp. MMK2]MCQ8230198.1 hypothetical protein [Pantoea sp. MMK2]MCQ8238904.1 hypothetical protein [Pantoea sp. MMK3]MCQ8238912.1 hypothetical protein [Pantoea sp. MMK3]MCW6034170.1 hypothetical protein [Pantoea sp. JK]